MTAIRLIVQADDFGMCHAVNTGVVQAFREGILSQASVMVPCPWFMEAVSLAKAHRIPVGLHATLTCDWDFMRWRPLTSGESLVDDQGTFHRTVVAAEAHVKPESATLELIAQAERMIASGLPPLYVDEHMGAVCSEAVARVCEHVGRPFLYPHIDPHPEFASIEILSAIPRAEKRDWLLDHLGALTPGVHFLQTHPGTASRELRALTAPNSPVAPWAEDYRVSDLAVLTDEDVVKRVAEKGIELASMATLYADL